MKKTGILIIALSFTGVLSFAGGQKESNGFSGDYEFGGSTTVEPIVLAAIEVFEEKYPDVNISYDSQGSSVGVRGVIEGTYSLGGASRHLKDSETEKGVMGIPIALDGVAVVVNKDSVNIDNLSLEEVTKIFSGEITDWSEVGGAPGEIVVFNRDEASGTRSCFDDATVGKMKKKFRSDAAIVTSNGDMVSKVGSTPNSIGYCGFGYIEKDPGTKPVNVEGIAPSEKNVLNDSYKISRKLLIVHEGKLEEGTLEKAFVDFLLSSDGQAIVQEEDFIPLQK